MFKNYFKTAWRNMVHNKVYAIINIIGLTVGLWACLIVATVVMDDLSYDKQWSKADNLYRIITVNKMGEGLYDRSPASFTGLAPELKKNYPEVEDYSLMVPSSLRLKLKNTDENGVVINSLSADTSIWHMLDIKITAGNPAAYKEGYTNLLLTESFVNKYFRGQNPVGRIIYDVPDFRDKPQEYLISGIIKDLPANTHLRAEVIALKFPAIDPLYKEQYGTFAQNYLLLRPGTDIKNFTAKVNDWYKNYVTDQKPLQYEFQPIKEVYLHSGFASYQKVKGDIQRIYIFSGIALLLLLIACVNFINLSTARAATRLRETGVRKILGAARKQIITQFLAESLLFFFIASVLALLLYQVSLNPVGAYLGHALAQTVFSRFLLFAAALGAILLISLFSGIYPAWLMSGFKPVHTLKGRLFSGQSTGVAWLRKGLVVLQFSISVVVIIAMLVVHQQLKYMEDADVGFDKENLLNISYISWDGKGAAFKNELLRFPGVQSASFSQWSPSNGAGFMSRDIDDPDHPGNKITVWYISGDIDLANTMGLRLQKGRLLSSTYATDAFNDDSLQQLSREAYNKASELRSCLVTAYTAKLLRINQLNKPVESIKSLPVGIIEDFHNQSFREVLGPTIIYAQSNIEYGNMIIRVKHGAEQQVMTSIQKMWPQFFPSKLLETNWVDDMLAKQYESEDKLRQLFTFFSLLTMILAALGIFGLIVHAAQQRTKEIGVRKVLGASVTSIARLLSADFIKLVLVAIVIASPVAWWVMSKWLQQFAYRTSIAWWVFVIAGIGAVAIAMITISFQAIKAAVANPVKSLRTE